MRFWCKAISSHIATKALTCSNLRARVYPSITGHLIITDLYHFLNWFSLKIFGCPTYDCKSIFFKQFNILQEDERKKRWAKCPALTKNFYQEAIEVKNLLPEDVERIRAENNNTTVSRVFENQSGNADIPNPVWKFEQCFAQYPDLLAEIQNQVDIQNLNT